VGDFVNPADKGTEQKAEHHRQHNINDRKFSGQVGKVENIHSVFPLLG